jgi:hypothetical protein
MAMVMVFKGIQAVRIEIFFYIKSCQYLMFVTESSFLCRFRIESVNVFVLPRFDLCHVLSSSTNNFAHAQMLSQMSSLSGPKTLTDSIRKRHKKEDSVSFVKIKKRCYSDLLHFSTRKHNLVSFFGRIIF